MKKYIIIFAILLIIGLSSFLGIKYYLSIPKDPKPIIEEMVKSYYENYLYEKNSKAFLNEEYDKKMEEFNRTGIKKSLFDIMDKVDHDDKHLLMNSKESKINCNFFETVVTYTPVAPYSKKDYKYDLKISCKIEK